MAKKKKNYCDKLHQEFNDAMRGKNKKTKSALDLLKQKYIQGDKKKEEIYKKEFNKDLKNIEKENKKFAEKIKNIIGLFSNKNKKKFKPQVFFNTAGDELEFILKANNYYGEFITSNLTVYRDQETNEIIGGCVHWVSDLIKKAKF